MTNTDRLADFVAENPRERMPQLMRIVFGLLLKAFVAGLLLGGAIGWAVAR